MESLPRDLLPQFTQTEEQHDVLYSAMEQAERGAPLSDEQINALKSFAKELGSADAPTDDARSKLERLTVRVVEIISQHDATSTKVDKQGADVLGQARRKPLPTPPTRAPVAPSSSNAQPVAPAIPRDERGRPYIQSYQDLQSLQLGPDEERDLADRLRNTVGGGAPGGGGAREGGARVRLPEHGIVRFSEAAVASIVNRNPVGHATGMSIQGRDPGLTTVVKWYESGINRWSATVGQTRITAERSEGRWNLTMRDSQRNSTQLSFPIGQRFSTFLNGTENAISDRHLPW